MTVFVRALETFFKAVAVAFLAVVIAGCGGDHHDHHGGSTPQTVFQQNSITLGDFNNDGRLDLAVASSVTSGSTPLAGQVDLFLQDPSHAGSFSVDGASTVGIDPFQIAAADLNGDMRPDMVTANATSDTISVLLNTPSQPGTFAPAVDYPVGTAPLSVAVGDLNNDGLPDLAVAVAEGIDILFQNPSFAGTFLQPALHLPMAGGAFSVAIGDLDGDGLPDIGAAGTDAVFVFFQNLASPGTFSAASVFTAGLQPNGVAIADMDQDGLLDIVIANIGSSTDGSGASFSVLIQDPAVAGNFLPVRNFATPNGTRNLAVGDLNGDGFPDVVVVSTLFNPQSAGVTSVFLNNATSPVTFLPGGTFSDGFAPQSVAIGDLNNDAKPDIAIQDGPAILFQDPLHLGTFFNEVVIGLSRSSSKQSVSPGRLHR